MWTDPDPVLPLDSMEVTSACCRKIQLGFTRKLLWTAVIISTSFDLKLRWTFHARVPTSGEGCSPSLTRYLIRNLMMGHLLRLRTTHCPLLQPLTHIYGDSLAFLKTTFTWITNNVLPPGKQNERMPIEDKLFELSLTMIFLNSRFFLFFLRKDFIKCSHFKSCTTSTSLYQFIY